MPNTITIPSRWLRTFAAATALATGCTTAALADTPAMALDAESIHVMPYTGIASASDQTFTAALGTDAIETGSIGDGIAATGNMRFDVRSRAGTGMLPTVGFASLGGVPITPTSDATLATDAPALGEQGAYAADPVPVRRSRRSRRSRTAYGSFGGLSVGSENIDTQGAAAGYDLDTVTHFGGIAGGRRAGRGVLGFSALASVELQDYTTIGARSEVTAYQGALGASYTGRLFRVIVGASYGDLDYEFHRDAGGPFTRAVTDGEIAGGSVELGFNLGRALNLRRNSLVAYAGLDGLYQTRDAFFDNGLGAVVPEFSTTTGYASAGLRFGRSFFTRSGVITPGFDIGYINTFGDRETTALHELNFGGADGVALIDEHQLKVGASLDVSGRRTSVTVGYEGNFGDSTDVHRAGVSVSLRF